MDMPVEFLAHKGLTRDEREQAWAARLMVLDAFPGAVDDVLDAAA